VKEHYAVIIIGAGLSGLHSTWQLQQQQKDFLLLESRPNTGGRITSPNQCDLGPAWVWPMMQPRLKKLFDDLRIKTMKQFTHGEQLYQFSADKIERFSAQSGHAQSYRIEGGIAALSDALFSKIAKKNVLLNANVTHMSQTPSGVEVVTSQGERYSANQVVIALPPRLMMQDIKLEPSFDAKIQQRLNDVATWMASQAKIVFVYDTPFWRNQQLSGEAMSQVGPLREISDACSADGAFSALSAFVGLSASQRSGVKQKELIAASLNQMQRFFGDEALTPKDVYFKDWAKEPLTCSELDLTTPSQHPHYPAHYSRQLWDEKLILSGSEMALEHGGYLEGAIESSIYALTQIK